jgi:hypothetical protein
MAVSPLCAVDEMIQATHGSAAVQALRRTSAQSKTGDHQTWHSQRFGASCSLHDKAERVGKTGRDVGVGSELYQPQGITLNGRGDRFVVRDHRSTSPGSEPAARRGRQKLRPRDVAEPETAKGEDIRHLGEYPQRLWVGILTKEATKETT